MKGADLPFRTCGMPAIGLNPDDLIYSITPVSSFLRLFLPLSDEGQKS